MTGPFLLDHCPPEEFDGVMWVYCSGARPPTFLSIPHTDEILRVYYIFSHSCVSHRNRAGQWFKFAGI